MIAACEDNYSCLKCQGISVEAKVVEILDKMKVIDRAISETDEKIFKNKAKKIELEEKYSSKIGPLLQKVNEIMKEKQISSESYYGNIFTGILYSLFNSSFTFQYQLRKLSKIFLCMF